MRRIIRITVRVTIGVLVALLIALGLLYWSLQPAPNNNRLALGNDAQVEQLAITLVPPIELDFMRRDEVLALRAAAVNEHGELLAEDYTPADAVFGAIEDGRPWWGMVGQYYFGPGPDSIRGPSEESRLILNPYLLVFVDFIELSIWWYGDFAWDTTRISESDLDTLPLTCAPQRLTWYPSERRANNTYPLSDCIDAWRAWTVNPLPSDAITVDFLAYNARDFNLNYLYIDYEASQNLSHELQLDKALRIPHYIHRGGSCGYTGGCNNMSPFVPELDGIVIEQLPASAVVKLWHEPPDQPHDTADMTFIIYFE